MRPPTITSAVKVPAKPGVKKPAKLLRPIIGLGLSCFVCGVLVSALLVSIFKNREIDHKVEQLAFTTERIRILESYAGVTPAPLTAAAPQEADVGPGNALVLASKLTASPPPPSSGGADTPSPGATLAKVAKRSNPVASPTVDIRYTSAADLPSPRISPAPPTNNQTGRNAQAPATALARPAAAKPATTSLPSPAAGRPAPPAAADTGPSVAALPAPQPRPAVEQPGAAVPAQATDSAVANSTEPVPSVSAAAAPASKPSIEAVNRIQAVPAKRAGVDRLESDAVYMLSGKRVGVGEKFDSGETLISVDPDKGKVVTSNRTLVLL